MKIRSLIGFFMALRTGTEEDSREAIGSSIAAHLPEKGKEGTGYLREGQRPPREFRAFYSSPPFVPPPETAAPRRWPPRAPGSPRGRSPRPRLPDDDGLLAPPETNGQEPAPVQDQAPMPLAPGELPPTLVDTIVDSLRATGARPPRQLWLPPLARSRRPPTSWSGWSAASRGTSTTARTPASRSRSASRTGRASTARTCTSWICWPPTVW